MGELIDTIEYDYPTFHLSMDCFWCEVVEGELELLEAEAAKWLTKDSLYNVQWLPADITLVEKIKMGMQETTVQETTAGIANSFFEFAMPAFLYLCVY